MAHPAPLSDLRLDPALVSNWALFLDFDGTLVEIAPRPEAIEVASCLPGVLEQLKDDLGGALALVSGRPIAELDRFLTPARLPAGGQHGLERRDGSGCYRTADIDRAALDEIRAELAAFVEEAPGTRLEAKSLAVALHYRQAPEFEPAAIALAEDLAGRYADRFHLQAGKMVLEIKPRGADKGTLVDSFLAEPPFSGRVPVYVGDDLTDEHGFQAVGERGGIPIQVGDREPTAARWRVPDVAGLHRWLKDLARMLEGTRS